MMYNSAQPIINVYENGELIKTFVIETLTENPDLTGQFFHICIRILESDAVMIDGIISKSRSEHPNWQDPNYEAIRLQPFFLSTAEKSLSNQLIGKGLFERGLHYLGTVTPTTVRVICICDNCDRSFTLQHFHAGFSESQYFYSNDSRQTLIVGYGEIENLPTQLQKDIDIEIIAEIELKLPVPTAEGGSYKYYNPLRCPYCLSAYIDFEANKEIRPSEYYGNKYINCKFHHLLND